VPVSPYDDGTGLADLILNLREATKVVRRDFGKMLSAMGLAFVIGLFVALGSGEEYTAETRILPYRSGGGTVSGLSGLAGLAGIRLPAGAGDQTITADLYPELINSQDFRMVVAETPLRFISLDEPASLKSYFRDLRTPPITELVSKYSIGLPSVLLATMRSNSNPIQGSAAFFQGDSGLRYYNKEDLKLIRELEKRLTVSVDRKTSVIKITARMPDAYAAADLVRISSNLLMHRIISYESRKAAEQFQFVSQQYERVKSRYEHAQQSLAAFNDRNRSLMSATSQVERDRLQREHDLAFEIYQQLSRELEQARIKMGQDTPVFTVIDQVTIPAEPTSPKRGKTVFLAVFFGFLAGIGRILLVQVTRNMPSITTA
jgi:G-rich domain on putative tyrosine kinase